MKKNLLSLALILSAGIYTSAQNTYINDAVTVKVNPNTLFFHGGDVNVKTSNTDSPTAKIINDGNIQINGNFTNENTKGKNFVNTYTDGANFGQLIIDESKNVTGNISIERGKPEPNNDYYPIGFPFQSSATNKIIDDMLGTPQGQTAYVGNCAVDTFCGDSRYNQTLLLWDIEETEYDAVPTGQIVKPGGSYTMKLNGGSIPTYLSNVNKMTLYGIPNNKSLNNSRIKSGIINASSETFSDYRWVDWKLLVNHYNETYASYLDNGSETNNSNVLYGKNLHRFSNPFTSNLDLSIINKPDPNDTEAPISWITFNISGSEKYPTEVFDTAIRFKINKLPNDLTVLWNENTGTSNTIPSTSTNKRISAYLQKASTNKYFWAGNPDALLVKPFEYFEINYYTINSRGNGDSRLVDANYKITDANKTFDQEYGDFPNFGNINGVYDRSNNYNNLINDDKLQSRGLVGPHDFTQVEFYLLNNNSIVDEAAYLVNSDFYTTGALTNNSNLNNKIFLFEENSNGTVNRNSQTLLNEFKNDYVGKPLGIGFKNLTNGDQYTIKLRLFEYSILNRVNNFNNGTYYLHDKNTNQISEINGNSEISFVADNNINNRFELYWNEVPRTLGTDDLSVMKATYVYKNENNHFVRFEDHNTKATVKVFDLNGRLISNHPNINTSEDLKLNIAKGSAVYIINIEYNNGTTVSKKIIQN